ncbi:hypothetical protein GCM10007907_07620 [Chitinimonas prasina]|uniref:Uncharacterized protein n=1 Tax=Chitinimonas prasina TaxID=1434937 RepID=A0ABQ5YAJ8_9NEIS|nr:hypothetical protein GCM10007907_07620 [Chitinimonas prasina]
MMGARKQTWPALASAGDRPSGVDMVVACPWAGLTQAGSIQLEQTAEIGDVQYGAYRATCIGQAYRALSQPLPQQ